MTSLSTPIGQSSTPVQALYPLEIAHPHVSTEVPEAQVEDVTTPSTDDHIRVRASRGTATRANEKFNRWAVELTEDVDLDR